MSNNNFPPGSAMYLSDVFGYLLAEEVTMLKKLCEDIEIETPIFVNIGAGAGTSSMAMTEARQDAIIFTVDKTEGSSPYGGLVNERNAYRQAGIAKIPHQIVGDSANIGKRWRTEYCDDVVDLLFIDGDHSPEQLTKDIISWYPNMSPGGVLVFHDYESIFWPGVATTVNRMIRDRYNVKPIAYTGNLIAFEAGIDWEWKDEREAFWSASDSLTPS